MPVPLLILQVGTEIAQHSQQLLLAVSLVARLLLEASVVVNCVKVLVELGTLRSRHLVRVSDQVVREADTPPGEGLEVVGGGQRRLIGSVVGTARAASAKDGDSPLRDATQSPRPAWRDTACPKISLRIVRASGEGLAGDRPQVVITFSVVVIVNSFVQKAVGRARHI